LKGLHDIRNYSDAEQVLILHRLLQPYSCGDIDIVPLKKSSVSSRSAPTKSRHDTPPAARNKPAAKSASSSETSRRDESTASKVTIATDDEKSSIGKTTDSEGGKGFKSKRYA